MFYEVSTISNRDIKQSRDKSEERLRNKGERERNNQHNDNNNKSQLVVSAVELYKILSNAYCQIEKRIEKNDRQNRNNKMLFGNFGCATFQRHTHTRTLCYFVTQRNRDDFISSHFTSPQPV